MLTLKNFRIESTSQGATLRCDVSSKLDAPSVLWFETDPENYDLLDVDEPSWAALALYYVALASGQDLIIEADISPRLLHNLRWDLGIFLRHYDPAGFSEISIDAGTSAPERANGSLVATGFSGGVDSMATVLTRVGPDVPERARINTLAIFQVGAMLSDDSRHRLAAAKDRARAFAAPHGLRVITLNSNLDAFYRSLPNPKLRSLGRTVSLRNGAGALALGRGIREFHPSGNVGYDRASFGPSNIIEFAEPVLAPLMTTEHTTFQAGAAGLSRPDKIAFLSDRPEAHRFLDVCVGPADKRYQNGVINCGECWKCAQTLAQLDGLGALDRFGAAFDLNSYPENRARIYENLVLWFGSRGQNHLDAEFEPLRQAGVPIPPWKQTLRRDRIRRHLRKIRRLASKNLAGH
ncbi:hypothetical protein ACJ5NV_03935 [Loktanella agnita]|uniref:hypothetical protein n=1 Tax=Loktanella agnita TaxID=287097 RepID=UPI0039857335